ncbi:MAG: efflux RND transporter periplasmic adaptor subunit [Pseudomonadota bacterium]
MPTGFKGTTSTRVFKALTYLSISVAIVLAIYWIKFAPVPASGHRVVPGSITAEVMGAGTLEARVKTTVGAKISGRITGQTADQGDFVKEGQVLAHLDDSELKQQAEIARSAQAAAEAALARVRSDHTRARVVLEQAELEYARNIKLYSNRTISASEIDKVKTTVKLAAADLSSALARVVEAQKNLALAQNTLDYHLARLADTIIKAPFSGLIVRRDRDNGDIVVPGTSICLLISPEKLWIRAWVDETEMDKLRVGQPARIVFRSRPDKFYDGLVDRLGRETDRETRQFLVDVTVNHLPVNWSVGQRAEVYITFAQKDETLTLPANLLVRNKNGEMGVLIAEQGRAAWRKVRLGLHGRDKVEILDGLAAGDIALAPKNGKKLVAGRRIEISDQ